ncbi:Uncharacterized protein QTN25_003307 [Entamoeba marina]
MTTRLSSGNISSQNDVNSDASPSGDAPDHTRTESNPLGSTDASVDTPVHSKHDSVAINEEESNESEDKEENIKEDSDTTTFKQPTTFDLNIEMDLFGKSYKLNEEDEVEDATELSNKHNIETKEKYSRLQVEEVFRESFYSTHCLEESKIPKLPLLPLPSPVLAQSISLPNDPFNIHYIGNAFAAKTTNYSAVVARVYKTHKIVLVIDPVHVANGDASAQEFAALFFKSYEEQLQNITSVPNTIEAIVEVLTDLDITFTSNKMVPVSFVAMIICDEDFGLAKIKPTVLSVCMGNISMFKYSNESGANKVCGNNNYRLGDNKPSDLKFHFDWSYFDLDDILIVTTQEQLKDIENPCEYISQTFKEHDHLGKMVSVFSEVCVAVQLEGDKWHEESFMKRPKKALKKAYKSKVTN